MTTNLHITFFYPRQFRSCSYLKNVWPTDLPVPLAPSIVTVDDYQKIKSTLKVFKAEFQSQ